MHQKKLTERGEGGRELLHLDLTAVDCCTILVKLTERGEGGRELLHLDLTAVDCCTILVKIF